MKNYFFSGWIANFGVEPLFSLAAFLFLPAFFLLICRFLSVMAVLDDMNKLLRFCFDVRRYKLYLLVILVKGHIWAKTPEAIILLPGEHTTLEFIAPLKFTVGQSGIIGTNVNAQTQTLTIKAKKPGHTEIILWQGQNRKQTIIHPVFVLENKAQFEILPVYRELLSLPDSPELSLKGDHLIIKGEVKDRKSWLQIEKIIQGHWNQIQNNMQLSEDTKKNILSDLYLKAFKRPIEGFRCQFKGSSLTCFVSDLPEKEKNYFKELQNQFPMHLVAIPSNDRKNYKIKIMIIQSEFRDEESFSLGLDRLQAQVNDLFDYGIRQFVNQNSIRFNQLEMNLSLIAEHLSLIGRQHHSVEIFWATIKSRSKKSFSLL
jgi:hypothetical protein